MPEFMDIHRGFRGVTQAELAYAHSEDLKLQDAEGVVFKTAWADPDSGLVFCLSEGPDRDAVARVHAQAGHPTEEVYPVPIVV